MGFKVFPVRCYLGGFIGDQVAEAKWLDEKVEGWAASIQKLLGVSIQNLLHQEGVFVQQFTPDIGNSFVPVITCSNILSCRPSSRVLGR